jgi:dipeptidyl aminopeptidase/acylaminoacyl peptidase
MASTPVSFYSDGYKLAGDLYGPAGRAHATPRPAVVLCHGYTGTRRIHLPDYAEYLSAAGYIVLAFDYRGWGDSEGPKRKLAPYTRVADAQAALSFMASLPQVDKERLALFGTSYGAGVAIWAAAIDPRVKCLVASIGVGNGRRWMRSVRRPDEFEDLMDRAAADRTERALTGHSTLVPRDDVLLPDRQSLEIGNAARRNNPAAVTELPLEFVDDTLSFNPEWIVDKIAPRAALFITSDADRLVPPEETEAMYARAGEPKKLVVLKGIGHYQAYSGDALRQIMDASIAWYRGHLASSEEVAQ